MSTTTLPAPPSPALAPGLSTVQERVTSIDALRGFTILVMIFVNDLAGVPGAPGWMKHIQPPDADGMTFVDVVFPAFLFIVGMSIPFAMKRRFERGDSMWEIGSHVLVRTISLLAIGVLMVNSDDASGQAPLPPLVWILLMYTGVILVWLSPPPSLASRRRLFAALRIVGIGLLIGMALLFDHDGRSGWLELRPSWWGILGIIGWAYLVAGLVYLVVRDRTTGLLGGVVLLYCAYIADAGGMFADLGWINAIVSPGSVAAHAAITLSGVVLGRMLLPGSPSPTPAARIRWTLLYAGALAAAAFFLHGAADVHQMFIVNKIYATPPWGLYCGAITATIWVGFYWLLDVRKSGAWSRTLQLSGQNALLAYIMAPIFYAGFAYLTGVLAVPNVYAGLGGGFATGLIRSIVFSIAVVWFAGALRQRRFVLRL